MDNCSLKHYWTINETEAQLGKDWILMTVTRFYLR